MQRHLKFAKEISHLSPLHTSTWSPYIVISFSSRTNLQRLIWKNQTDTTLQLLKLNWTVFSFAPHSQTSFPKIHLLILARLGHNFLLHVTSSLIGVVWSDATVRCLVLSTMSAAPNVILINRSTFHCFCTDYSFVCFRNFSLKVLMSNEKLQFDTSSNILICKKKLCLQCAQLLYI